MLLNLVPTAYGAVPMRVLGPWCNGDNVEGVPLERVPRLRPGPEYLRRPTKHLRRCPEHLRRCPEYLRRCREHLRRPEEHLRRPTEHLRRPTEHLRRPTEGSVGRTVCGGGLVSLVGC